MRHVNETEKKLVCEKIMGEIYPEISDWRIIRPTLIRRDVRIYKVESQTARQAVAVKIFNKDAKQNAAEMHYKALSFYYSQSSDVQGFTVPRPYGLITAHDAVVMEWINAPRISDILLKFPGSRREENIKRAALWLRWFHKRSQVKEQVFDLRPQLKNIKEITKKVNTLNPQLIEKDRLLKDCVSALVKMNSNLGNFKIPHATLHGDFTPTNIFIDGPKTIGFDFSGIRRGAVTQDVCRFLLYLDIYRYSFTKAQWLRKYGCNEKDYETFMTYYLGRKRFPEKIFLYLQFAEIIRRYAVLLLLKAKGKRGLLRQVEMFRLRRTIKNILSVTKNVAA